MAGLMLSTSSAEANNFSNIAENITTSISGIPGLLSGVAYMFGILLGVLGILKIKDHVENPAQTPLKDGAIRLAAGGGLFALPIVYEAMQQTLQPGAAGVGVSAAQLNAVDFALAGGP
jgi:hypothetical protein